MKGNGGVVATCDKCEGVVKMRVYKQSGLLTKRINNKKGNIPHRQLSVVESTFGCCGGSDELIDQ